jgi:hypothetical protein
MRRRQFQPHRERLNLQDMHGVCVYEARPARARGGAHTLFNHDPKAARYDLI